MNIWTLPGKKIKVTAESAINGSAFDMQNVSDYLTIEKEYTVDYSKVGGYHTDIYLVEVPNISFNSVNFSNVTPQTDHEDQLHPDWKKYN